MNKELFDSLSYDMQDIYLRYCLDDDISGLTMDSVILSEDNRKKVDNFLTETEYKEKFMEHGLKPINRMLNYGASGTGKTFLTKCLASHLGYELLSIDIAKALSTGVAPTALEDIFTLANEIGKAIIFLDECDAIARSRDDKSVPEDPQVRRANNALFQLLDRMNPTCIFVSATNLEKELDTAFKRRFNVFLQFFRPPITDMDDIIHKFLLPGFEIEDDMDKDVKDIILYHAGDYTGLSYFGIQDWVERAEKLAIIADRDIVLMSDIYRFFMEAMRIQISYDDKGKPYLYQPV